MPTSRNPWPLAAAGQGHDAAPTARGRGLTGTDHANSGRNRDDAAAREIASATVSSTGTLGDAAEET